MAIYDFRAAAKVAGEGGDFPQAVGAAFGVPNCLLNLGRDVLSILPTSVLGGMASELGLGMDLADSVMKSINNWLRDTFGIIQWDLENGGFIFISASSKNGYDRLGPLSNVLGLLNAATALGGRLYQNYQAAENQINGIRTCIRDYKNYLKYRDGNSANELATLTDEQYEDYINSAYSVEIAQMQQAQDFMTSASAQLDIINDLISARVLDPSLEPLFNCEALQYLSGTTLAIQCAPEPQVQKEIFRLVYGPPKSTYGQFVLSNDGVYFDSQSSGILPALTFINQKKAELQSNKKWKFDYAPNLGGRGDAFSTEDLKSYVNTVLDPDRVNDSQLLKSYYDNDLFLQQLIGAKNKRVYDISGQISDLEANNAPESIIYNLKQSLISENSYHLQVINKRKKQIELAVTLPSIYGGEIIFDPGQIPLNDFSYLAGLNISFDIQKQKALMFSQVDISGVVSPLQTSSAVTVPQIYTKQSSVEHLILPTIGDGAIIYDGYSISSVDSVILQAENFIATDSMISMYNFLETTLDQPSSTSYSLKNYIAVSSENYAQLVCDDQELVFKSGLGIPFLKGITSNSSSTPTSPSALGSYVKLPNIPQYNDLLYSKSGATIDFWTYTPNLSSIASGYDYGGVSSLYRLVLANENTGILGPDVSGSEASRNDFGDKSVRGFIMGFTRDRRLCADLPPSNNTNDNPVSGSAFFLAPTQSLSASSVGLINRSFYDSDNCSNANRYHSMVVKLNNLNNDRALSSCGKEFCNISVTLDSVQDKISVYFDGEVFATSSLSYVFGVPPYTMPNIPTFKKSNSFEYNSSSVGSLAPNSLKAGPKLDRYFTPWIVGGGYTDGMALKGNFMGGQYGGIISGLRGYLGSLKFYSRPLTGKEILNNYKSQKDFFKNIDVWHPSFSK
jgi:hypothetical protein